VPLDVDGTTYELTTDRGVFSGERVDPGTRVLLDVLPRLDDLPEGAFVDVGCGYGPIALTLAARHPDRAVVAVDVNERARELCAANARNAGLAVEVHAPDAVPAGLRVAAVVSNPPIRVGKAVLHDLLTAWLDRLVDGGEAWLVVQRHLGAESLADWLVRAGLDRREGEVQEGLPGPAGAALVLTPSIAAPCRNRLCISDERGNHAGSVPWVGERPVQPPVHL